MIDFAALEGRARRLTERGLDGLVDAVADADALADAAPLHHVAGALVDWHQLWTSPDVGEDWLIAPVIARGRAHSFYAPAKAGKSLFLLYLAACAASGRPVLDHPGGEPVRVLYADMEMTRADLRERLTDMGFGPDDDLSSLVYYSLPNLAALDTPQGGAELVALARHHAVDLVVIDTLSRVIAGEENANDTIIAFARHTGTPLKAAGIAAIRADHAGKDLERGGRGASAKADDVDVVWQYLPRDRGRFTLKATHRRIAWVPEVVDLEQGLDPLGYKVADGTWPAGTKDAADLLDRLDVPIDAGRDRARKAVKAAGEKAGTDALAAALRWRRQKASAALVVLPGGAL